ncbi:MAG: HAD family phosphatase [Mobilitalea sp.]
MITTIILDIGNVLAAFRSIEYLRECGYEEEIIRKIGNATFYSEKWKELDRGVIEEDDLIAQFCEQDPSVTTEILSFFDNFDQIVTEYDYSAPFVQKLKANGYQVYLLSNYGRRYFIKATEVFEFYKYVDGGVISYEVNFIKPEPEIYEALISKYNINPTEAVFLDDMNENLVAAREFGFHTIHVKAFDEALEKLRKLGVNI